MSTENVAILFTDIVGSTELSQRLSPEAADEVRRGHFSILRQAITESGGTEVKNLGDGLMVVFVSASAALACAVAMQQGVERDNRGRRDTVGSAGRAERGRGQPARTTTTSGTRWSRRPGCAHVRGRPGPGRRHRAVHGRPAQPARVPVARGAGR